MKNILPLTIVFLLSAFFISSNKKKNNFTCSTKAPIVSNVKYGDDLILRTSKFLSHGMVRDRVYFEDQGLMFRAEVTTKGDIIIYGEEHDDANLISIKDSRFDSLLSSINLFPINNDLFVVALYNRVALINGKGEVLNFKDYSIKGNYFNFLGLTVSHVSYNKERNSLFFMNDIRKTGFNLDLCELKLSDLSIHFTGVKAPNGKLNYGLHSMPEICAGKNEVLISYPYSEVVNAYAYDTWIRREICAGSNFYEPMKPAIKNWNNTQRMDHRFTEPFFSRILFLEKQDKYARLYYKRKDIFEKCENQTFRYYGRSASMILFDSNLNAQYEVNLPGSLLPLQIFKGSKGIYYSELSCNDTTYNAANLPHKFIVIE